MNKHVKFVSIKDILKNNLTTKTVIPKSNLDTYLYRRIKRVTKK